MNYMKNWAVFYGATGPLEPGTDTDDIARHRISFSLNRETSPAIRNDETADQTAPSLDPPCFAPASSGYLINLIAPDPQITNPNSELIDPGPLDFSPHSSELNLNFEDLAIPSVEVEEIPNQATGTETQTPNIPSTISPDNNLMEPRENSDTLILL
ncbi:unnamed protein product [Arctia plantaginis]|uniref:Uncharacterized protein n=1 Tax=Arctia plantaginis TaxID=874455 RepID=A0A8S1B480_ARCPL|nr:unnamed protein product [Arctia plantaginis]